MPKGSMKANAKLMRMNLPFMQWKTSQLVIKEIVFNNITAYTQQCPDSKKSIDIHAISENFHQMDAKMGLDFDFDFQAARNQGSIQRLPPVPRGEQDSQHGLVT